jgi:hypothetical protein
MKNKAHVSTFFLGVATIVVVLFIGSASAQGPIVNFVHAGGPDLEDGDVPGSEPGFDKNFSLMAFRYADGSASGTLTDGYAGGGNLGLRAQIDCVHVVGNTAWVSGVVTRGRLLDADGNPVDIAGYYVRTAVQDNGNNSDPSNPDKIAFSAIRSTAPFVCTTMVGTLFDMPHGQVTVR